MTAFRLELPIEITKKGDGATRAVADLRQLTSQVAAAVGEFGRLDQAAAAPAGTAQRTADVMRSVASQIASVARGVQQIAAAEDAAASGSGLRRVVDSLHEVAAAERETAEQAKSASQIIQTAYFSGAEKAKTAAQIIQTAYFSATDAVERKSEQAAASVERTVNVSLTAAQRLATRMSTASVADVNRQVVVEVTQWPKPDRATLAAVTEFRESLARAEEIAKQEERANEGAARSIKQVGESAETTAPRLSRLGSAAEGVRGGVTNAAAGVGNFIKQALAVAGIVLTLQGAFGLLERGVRAFGATAIEAFEYNSLMEQSRLGIASLLTSFGEVREETGRVVEGQQAFNASLSVAEQMQKKLRKAAIETSAEYDDLVRALQESVGPALRAGFNPDQIVKFTQLVAQSAAAIGLPMQQLGQEIRALFAGDIGPDSRLANLLFSDIPRNKIRATVLELQKSGQFFQEMERRMSAFGRAGELSANTYAGALSNLKDAFKQALGEAFLGATGQATSQIKELTTAIVTFDEQGNAHFNQTFVDGLRTMAAALVAVTQRVVTFIARLDDLAINFQAIKEQGAALVESPAWQVITWSPGQKLAGLAFDVLAEQTNARAAEIRLQRQQEMLAQRSELIGIGSWARRRGISSYWMQQGPSAPGAVDSMGRPLDGRPLPWASKIGVDALPRFGLQGFDQAGFDLRLGQWMQQNTPKIFSNQGYDQSEINRLKSFFAAITAAAKDGIVTLDEFEQAKDRVITGATVKGKKPADGNELTAKLQHDKKAMEEMLASMKDAAKLREIDQKIVGEQTSKLQAQLALAKNEQEIENESLRVGGLKLDQHTKALLLKHAELETQIVDLDTSEKKLNAEKAYQTELDRIGKERRENQQRDKQFQIDGSVFDQQQRDAETTYKQELGRIDADAALQRQQAGQREKQFRQGLFADERKMADARIAAEKTLTALQTQRLAQLQEAYDSFFKSLGSNAKSAIDEIFAGRGFHDAARGAVDSFRGLLSNMLGNVVDRWLVDFQKKATDRLVPVMRQNDKGAWEQVIGPDGQPAYNVQKADPRYQRGLVGVQAAAALYGLYQNGQAGVSSRANGISGAVQGAMLGTAIAPGIGTAIGAVVGAVAGSLTGNSSKTRYQVSVVNGRIVVTGVGKFNQSDLDTATRQLNDTVTAAVQSAWALLDAFPAAIAEAMALPSSGGLFPDGTSFADQIKHVRTTAISIFKKSLAGGMTGDDLKHFEDVELPQLILDKVIPIFTSGLDQLGVGKAKIDQLIATAHSIDPKQAFQFMTDYVTGFVTMKDQIDFLSKSREDKLQFAGDEANKTVPQKLGDLNDEIKRLGAGFADLDPQEQVARIAQINAKVKERYDLELQYLAEIEQTRKSINESIRDQIFGIQLGQADRPQQTSMLEQRRADVAQRLANAKSPAEVAQLSQEFQQLTGQIFDLARAVHDEFKSLIGDFASFDAQRQKDDQADLDPASRMAAINAQILKLADGFDQLTGEDQLTRGRELLSLANERYQLERQALKELASTLQNIKRSIADQIFDIEQSQRTPQQQTDAVLARQRGMYDELKNAKTAAEVQDIVSRMQANVNTLYDLEGRTPQAAALMLQMLAEIQTASEARVHQIEDGVKNGATSVEDIIRGIGITLQQTFENLPDAAAAATQALENWGDQAGQKLDKFVDQVIGSDQTLFNTLTPIFTAFAGSMQQTDSGFDDVNVRLGRFRDLLDDVNGRLLQFPSRYFDGDSSPSSSALRSTSSSAGTATAFSSPSSPTILTFSPQVNVYVDGNLAPLISAVKTIARNEAMEVFSTYTPGLYAALAGGRL